MSPYVTHGCRLPMYHPARLRIRTVLSGPSSRRTVHRRRRCHLEPLDGRFQRVQATLHTPIAVQYVQCAAHQTGSAGQIFCHVYLFHGIEHSFHSFMSLFPFLIQRLRFLKDGRRMVKHVCRNVQDRLAFVWRQQLRPCCRSRADSSFNRSASSSFFCSR